MAGRHRGVRSPLLDDQDTCRRARGPGSPITGTIVPAPVPDGDTFQHSRDLLFGQSAG